MNWTGGRLQRHSKQNGNVLVNRQKQHFAQVRTNLLHAPPRRSSPFLPSYLRDRDAAESAPRTHRRQKTLEEFESVAPVVERLGSLRQRADGGRRRKRKVEEQVEGDADADADAVGRSGQRNVRARAGRDERDGDAGEHRVRSSTLDESLIREKTRGSKEQDEQSLLEENRKKLLQWSDWAALAPTRPLRGTAKTPLTTRKPETERRKPDLIHRAGDTFALAPRKHGLGAPVYLMSGALPSKQHDIKIRIGPDALESHLSTVASDVDRNAALSQPRSSDTMLLDDEADSHVAADAMGPSHRSEAGSSHSQAGQDRCWDSLDALLSEGLDMDGDDNAVASDRFSFHDEDSSMLDERHTGAPRAGTYELVSVEEISEEVEEPCTSGEEGWRNLLLPQSQNKLSDTASERYTRAKKSSNSYALSAQALSSTTASTGHSSSEVAEQTELESIIDSTKTGEGHPATDEQTHEAASSISQSVPPSLQRIVKLAKHPSAAPLRQDTADELWKKFVFGEDGRFVSEGGRHEQFEDAEPEPSTTTGAGASSMRAVCSCSSLVEGPASSVVVSVGDGTTQRVLQTSVDESVNESSASLVKGYFSGQELSSSGGLYSDSSMVGMAAGSISLGQASVRNNASNTENISSPDPLLSRRPEFESKKPIAAGQSTEHGSADMTGSTDSVRTASDSDKSSYTPSHESSVPRYRVHGRRRRESASIYDIPLSD